MHYSSEGKEEEDEEEERKELSLNKGVDDNGGE